MNMFKRFLAMFLVACLMFSAVPVTTFAAKTDNTTATATGSTVEKRILHLDCGRKYFTKDWIIALINEMAAAGYTHLELAFGNDGLRFLLDDMSVGTYTDDQVTAAIKQGNRDYYNFGTNELTQSEMDAIIAHANNKGIKIIPLLNNPGHMNVIVSAATSLTGRDAGYNGSSSTVDLENSAAVSFTKGLVEKYIRYFAGKGCTEFNIGADEYANDKYSTGSMGFGALVLAGKYQLFVNYVNEMAALVKDAGMVPMAFNDGIYFNQNTGYKFDTDIMVAFWTSGWSGYQSASASTMASKGHKMINVNGDYYYVLGKNDQWDSNGYTYASNWNNSAFMGSNVSNPAGSMFCIWCDYPNAETETQIAANTRMILRAMAAEMQGKSANSISTDVVSGGFNADGTIAEEYNNVTVKDETAAVEVTGRDLTSVTAVDAEAPKIADASNVKAWDITPYIGTQTYTGVATVKLPVPEGWNTALVKGFYVENGEAVLVKGEYADGYYTFEMPHFSIGGLAEVTYDHLIELIAGESQTVLIEGVDLTGNTFIPDPAGIASVSTAAHNVPGSKELVRIESLDEIVSGGKYVLVNTRSGNMLGIETGYAGTWGTTCLVQEKGNASVNSPYWTITASGTNYYLQNSSGKYMTIGYNSANLVNSATALTIHDYNDKDNTFAIGQYSENYYTTFYLNDMGGAGGYAGGYFELNDPGAHWEIYHIVETETSNGTNVTFTGVSVGETFVTINNEVYKIVVSYQEKTLNIVVNSSVSDTQSAQITGAPSYTVEGIVTAAVNGNTVTFRAGNTLGTTVVTVGNTRYTVNVIEFNITGVSPLTLELWITNSPASTVANGNVVEIAVQAGAEGIFSEAGVDVSRLAPVTAYRGGDALSYWRSRLLQGEENHQIQQNGVDKTSSGLGFTKIRYWNSDEGYSWQVLSGDIWQKVNLAEDQLVAYYMQVTEVTDEVTTRVVDWGPQYGDRGNMSDWFWGGYVAQGNYIFLDFAVVYEGGTMSPSSFPNNKTVFFTVDGITRSINGMLFTEDGEYEIWKVTATDGKGSLNNYNPGVNINYPLDDADAEVTLWEIEDGGVPYISGFENIPRGEGKLIRIYVRAVKTEDSLKVVYYDEVFGDVLVDYNVNVPNGSNFSNGIVYADTDSQATLPAFKTNPNRKDATGFGIVNALGKTQNFRTDLTKVPEAVGKYNNGLYTYTGSEISTDGKTITHFYTINTTTLSPNFVADFGLPLRFPLSQVVGAGQAELVERVTVNERTRYGTLTYDAATEMFTYTPTTILLNIDVLSINIKFTTTTEAKLTNVGVTPATTVYYGEQFLNFSGNWSTEGTYVSNRYQQTEVLGGSTYYGYDDAYSKFSGASDGTAKKSVTIGDTATFTFAGTGIQIFANSTLNSGYVSVLVRNHDTGAVVKVSMVDTVTSGTVNTDTTGGQIGKDLAGLPIVSLVDLTGLPHATYDVVITKIMDTDPVYIDGIRVFESVAEQDHFVDDEEDNPDFYEVRDIVLKALNITVTDSVDYKTLFDQIYASTIEVGASAVITNANVAYGTMNRQDLLDNGPKNELYLFPGDKLTINVTTNRVIQLGLKAPQGSASFKLNETGMSLSTSVDMFYKVAEKGGTTHTITVENTGDTILSVTLLKVCDDPNFAFAPLTEENIKDILAAAGYVEAPAEPEKPTYTMVELKGTDVLIDGTVFDYTGSPIEPAITVKVNGTKLVAGRDYSVTYVNNVEPGTATVIVRGIATASETLGYTGEIKIDYTINAPAVVYADATLKVKLVDYTGKVLATSMLVANGKELDTAVFTAEEIMRAANAKLPKKYAFADEAAVADVEVNYGDSEEITILVGKTATLNITYVNLLGRKVGTATITVVQTAKGYCCISASQINAQAPGHRLGLWLLPVVVSYGTTASIVVPVI